MSLTRISKIRLNFMHLIYVIVKENYTFLQQSCMPATSPSESVDTSPFNINLKMSLDSSK